jgi:chromosome condensin MukBEF MukE localization factor
MIVINTEALKADEAALLKRVANNGHGDVLAGAYPPRDKSNVYERLRRKGLLTLRFGTTTYSLYSITEAGRRFG